MGFLDESQRQKLAASGMTSQQIADLESGNAPDPLVNKANMILTGQDSGMQGGYTPPFGGVSAWNTQPPTSNAPLTGGIIDIASGRKNLPAPKTPYPQIPYKVDTKSLPGWAPPAGWSSATNKVDPGWNPLAADPHWGDTNSLGGPVGTHTDANGNPIGAPTTGDTGTGDTGGGMPGLPDLGTVAATPIEMRDFTDPANKMAADAFAPFLAAFDIARTNAQAQGKTSKEATAGLYSNFVKDIASKAAETADRYDDLKAGTAQRTTQQQSDIQENAQSANANLGDQLKAYGLEQSIPSTLQQGVAQQTNAQNVAGQAGESQQQFYDTEKMGQANQDTRYGELAQQQGIGAQGEIDSQLMSTLAGIDINKANAQGEQGTTALQLAQQLADRDFQMQNANAGNSLQAAGLNQQGALGQYGMQWDQYKQGKAEDQQNWENTFNQNKLDQANASAGTQFDMSNYPPGASRALGILLNGTSGDQQKSDQAFSIMDQKLSDFQADVANTSGMTPQQIADKFAQQTAQTLSAQLGIPVSTALAAAREMYANNQSVGT